MATGSAEHIEGEELLDDSGFDIYDLQSPVRLAAAGGILEVTKAISLASPTLGVDLERLLVPGSPLALSIGKLCIENGFAFWWPWFSYRPFLISWQ